MKQKMNISAVGWTTILSGLLALACLFTMLAAVNFNADALSDPNLLLGMKNISVSAARWSMLFDMLGYYLLLLPLVWWLHAWYRGKTAWANLITFSGLAYIIIGAIGAAILAVVYPSVLSQYPGADETGKAILAGRFELVNEIVYGGMWNLLEQLFAATWWLGLSFLFIREHWKTAGITALLTGVACGADGLAGIVGYAPLHMAALNAYLLLAVIFAFVTGVKLLGYEPARFAVLKNYPPPGFATRRPEKVY